ncbi:MAG: glycoside hydrolase 100 family protein [Planctomycetota bacterium]
MEPISKVRMKDLAVTPTIGRAAGAAKKVLLHNNVGPCEDLPRTAAWGYPEPYTRDQMIVALANTVIQHRELMRGTRLTLEALARSQSRLGHIPSYAHAPDNRGASDTTPLFLIGLAAYRRAANRPKFLDAAAQQSLTWLAYQSPDDKILLDQQPTTDWRDEQWVPGFPLFLNVLLYATLRLHGQHDRADQLYDILNATTMESFGPEYHQGLVVPDEPFYALWVFKSYGSRRFDLVGNSLAILTGVAPPDRARAMVEYVEQNIDLMRQTGQLTLESPPCLFPYIGPYDRDWQPRYEQFCQPGHYHNGGVWPFTVGFYVAALVALGWMDRARDRLRYLSRLVRPARNHDVKYGFNEWFNARTGVPSGNDWQSWSASMYLYAAACVATGTTPLFDECRAASPHWE